MFVYFPFVITVISDLKPDQFSIKINIISAIMIAMIVAVLQFFVSHSLPSLAVFQAWGGLFQLDKKKCLTHILAFGS